MLCTKFLHFSLLDVISLVCSKVSRLFFISFWICFIQIFFGAVRCIFHWFGRDFQLLFEIKRNTVNEKYSNLYISNSNSNN